jgi:protein phosphatase-4 regulatory subunit 3
VVPIRDPTVEQKIHQTYRLQYMKDVVLARILDDPTFSVLNSLIFFNQFDIVLHLQSTPTFLKELFDIFSNPESTMEKKKQAVLFIQNTTQIAKTIQATARIQLYANLINNGLFGVIDYALMQKDPGFRVAGTDVLVALIDHDPLLMRQLIYRQISNKEKPLTHTLIELLLGEPDLGVKAQIADAIRVLLDHSTSFDMHKSNEMAVRLHARSQQQQMDSEAEGFLKTFYEESAKKLFAPLRDLQSRTTCESRHIFPQP